MVRPIGVQLASIFRRRARRQLASRPVAPQVTAARFAVPASLFFGDPRTGYRMGVFVCTDDPSESLWLAESGVNRVWCCHHLEEHAVVTLDAAPLRLRRLLERGVRTMIAESARAKDSPTARPS